MRDSGVNEGENASGQGTRRVNSLDSRRKTRHERREKGAHLRLEGMARRREGGDKDGAQAAATDEEQNRGLLSSSSHQPSIRAFLNFFHPTQQSVSRGPGSRRSTFNNKKHFTLLPYAEVPTQRKFERRFYGCGRPAHGIAGFSGTPLTFSHHDRRSTLQPMGFRPPKCVLTRTRYPFGT